MTSPVTDNFEVQIFDDCRKYLDFCADFMAQDPYSTNVISVVATGIVAGQRNQGSSDIFIAVCRGDSVIGMGMHTPPFRLFLSRMPVSAATQLAAALFELEHHTPGVNGERTAVTAFAQNWTHLNGGVVVAQTSTRLYKLDVLKSPTNVPGTPRLADRSDESLVATWLSDFHDEASPHEPTDNFQLAASRRIKAGEIHLWIHGGNPVSLAGRRPSVCDIARIGPVYTPKKYRGQGFGTAVTAAATKYALTSGATQVALYTDLSNPTSNSIYQKIGYFPDHDGQELLFT